MASAATASLPVAGVSGVSARNSVGSTVLPSRWGDEAQRSYPEDPLLAGLTAPPASPAGSDTGLGAVDTCVDVNGIPVRVLTAYRAAADRVNAERPRCSMFWGMLAAIGQVETGHGRFGGAAVDTEGRVLPEILGPRLDGAGEFAEIRDSDGGLYDRDLEYDRAVGPMQFLPTTWEASGADADGRRDPHDIDDVALAAGRYLCAAGSFASPAGSVQAVFSYNHSYEYVRLVLTLAAGYSGHTPASLGIDLLPPPPGAPVPGPVPPPPPPGAPPPPPGRRPCAAPSAGSSGSGRSGALTQPDRLRVARGAGGGVTVARALPCPSASPTRAP